jgi:hypothetical protein
MSPRISPTPSDAPSTPMTTVGGMEITWENTIEWAKMAAYEMFRDLKDMGGRPSREVDADPGPCPASKSNTDEKYHIPDHWNAESRRIKSELTRWLDFRWHQFNMRKDLKTFDLYKKNVGEHWIKNGLGGRLQLQLDRQTKLDEWREYYLYEHEKRSTLEKGVELAKQELEHSMERMRKAGRNGSLEVCAAMLSSQWENLDERHERLSQAREEVDMAQRRLDVLSSEKMPAARRRIMIMQAEEELEAAEKTLVAEQTSDFGLAKREAERRHTQQTLALIRGKLSNIETCLKQLDNLLEWITGQSADIATEYALPVWKRHHQRRLLEGWEKYYFYMHRKLLTAEAKQDEKVGRLRQGWQKEQTKERELLADAWCPQERVRPLQALVAWIEKEFPKIAARRAAHLSHSPIHCSSQEQVEGNASVQEDLWRRTRSQGLCIVQQRSQGKAKRSNTCYGNDAGLSKNKERHVAMRRSKRIEQACNPGFMLASARQAPSQCCTTSTLRRSARLLELASNLHCSQSEHDTQSTHTGKRNAKTTIQRTAIRMNVALSKTPQGVSKIRRRK